MIKDILVCLEGSASTQRAIDVATRLARQLGATLVGLAIVDEPEIRAGAATSIGGGSYKRERDDALVADAHQRAQQWLRELGGRCESDGVPVRLLELSGAPAATILEEMKRHDLTILGHDVNFRFETQERDEQTRDRLLQRAGRPVIVVPQRTAPTRLSALVAFDGSKAAVRALCSFAESGLAHDLELHVAAVDDDGALAWEMAERGRMLLGDFGLSAKVHNLVSTLSVGEALLEKRKELGAGLIVLGGYTRSRFSRLLWGSVTDTVLTNSVVPVWVHY